MNKYKIYVYAISKNEEKFIDRWYESVKDADGIYVLDTGSTDNTVEKLKSLGVFVVQKEIKPWRFDVARNESLKLVPKDADICVCIDIDEVLCPGWKEKLQMLWKTDTTRLRYNYNWSHDENKKPLVNFYIEKIHSRNGYKWTHPVHEVLKYDGDKENFVSTNDITVDHFPDDNKSRSSYLPLLELSVKEDPLDDRNIHYLGREYMFYGKYNEPIDTLIKHLSLEKATWKDERCASMRFIARCYKYLKRYDEARMWLDKAIKEAPYLRDGYTERALLEYELNNYNDAKYFLEEALKIKEHTKSYINEPFCWNETIYDLLSLTYFYLGEYDKALKYVNIAISINPNDERIKNNKILMDEKRNSLN